MHGWRCPGCGRCYSPLERECTACNLKVSAGQPVTTTTYGVTCTCHSNQANTLPCPIHGLRFETRCS